MKRLTLAIFVLFLICVPAFAQKAANASGAELVYVDGSELTVTYADGTVFDYKKGGVTEGDVIPVGATIKTGAKTLAELRLKPNKSILKLARGTNFRIDGLAASSSAKTNAMTLAAGKIRVIASKLSGDEQFKIKGQTAVCGVRGTDFAFSSNPGSSDRLTVKSGLVALWRLAGQAEDSSTSVSVGSGQYVDAISQGLFAVMAAGSDIMSDSYGGMDFIRAKESEVPGHEVALATPAPSPSPSPDVNPSPEASSSPEASTEPGAAASPEAIAAASPSPEASPPATAKPSPKAPVKAAIADVPIGAAALPGTSPAPQADKPAAKESPFMQWLRDFLNAEIGAITINDQTYAKAVLQPVIVVGKLKTALYLPIIYQKNLFDPADWYHPQGNDEWSFGTDIGWKAHTLGAFTDALKDLALKVKYLEYGDQQFDPFFIKVGNLASFTLGHGMLMKDYANDSEFPVLRRVGLDVGMNVANSKPFGFELLANDLADPEIFGGRILVRPIKNASFGIGLSTLLDISPASMLNTAADPAISASLGDPMIAGLGLDLDAPILNTDFLAIKAFADVGAIVPIVMTDYSLGGQTVAKGFKYEVLWDDGNKKLQNWGAMAGALGSIASIFDWRAELRYSTGSFKHNMFDKNYDANRGKIAAGYSSVLADPSLATAQPDVMGVYGEGGFSLFKDKLSFTLGYFWPWAPEYGFDVEKQMGVLSNDKLHAVLVVKKGLIPVVDLAGSIGYDRSGFASALGSGASAGNVWAMLFDENTSFHGELLFPMPKAPNLDIALLFSLAPERDGNGDIVFEDEAGLRPSMIPVLSLETRLHF
jgi:hypothetical protein